MSFFAFLSRFLSSPSRVGAVAPSSARLGDLMVRAGQVHHAETVVEFGSGTGVFTECICRHLLPDAVFLAVELDPHFAELTRQRCPGVRVVEGCAQDTAHFLEWLGKTHCDCIVSGLPWASFSDRLQDDLLGVVERVLKPGGRFVTFTYVQSPLLPAGRRFRRKLEERFARVSTTPVVWRNIPPAFAYTAEKEGERAL